MSFDRERSIIAQNAGTTAANLVATIIQNIVGDWSQGDAVDLFTELRQLVFDGTLELAGAGSSPVGVADVVREFPGTTTEAPTGGGANGSYKFTSGKYAGKSIAEVDSIPAGGANRDGGRGYLEYYAENGKQENVVRAVKSYLAAAA